MAFFIFEQHVGLFMFLCFIGSVAAGESLEEKAEPGQDVTLHCSSSTHAAITKLEWSRPELKDEYVFFFRDNKLFESYQDPRYHGRVELKDPKMKNGNASVLLKNVTKEDSGTYECWVITLSNNRRKRNAYIQLIVSEGPEKEINGEHPKNGDANDEHPKNGDANDEHPKNGDANDEHPKNGDANDEHPKNGDANDELPGDPRGNAVLGVGLGLVCLVLGVAVVVGGLVVKSKRAKEERPLESVDVKLNP